MENVEFNPTEVEYLLHILGRYYLFDKDIRKAMRILSMRLSHSQEGERGVVIYNK